MILVDRQWLKPFDWRISRRAVDKFCGVSWRRSACVNNSRSVRLVRVYKRNGRTLTQSKNNTRSQITPFAISSLLPESFPTRLDSLETPGRRASAHHSISKDYGCRCFCKSDDVNNPCASCTGTLDYSTTQPSSRHSFWLKSLQGLLISSLSLLWWLRDSRRF